MTRFRDDMQALHDRARAETGLDDFGDPDYLEGLQVLLGSLDDEAPLNEIGRQSMRATLVDSLKARLRSEQGFKSYPEADSTPIDAPLVIIGLPRTGTTALHDLISQDPSLQGLELWLASAPKPRPPRAAWPEDADFRACDEETRALLAMAPDLARIHPTAADRVDECWRLLLQHFAHSGYEAATDVPSYSRWWATYDMRPAYRRHRRNLRLIGHREPDRRWLLKDATHLFHLDAFLDVYPDAQIVMTHRDPVRLIPSVCSLCWTLRAPQNEVLDRKAFGRSTLELWDRAIHHAMQVRAQYPDSQFLDLPFNDFRQDALGTIERIYSRFELPYTDVADERIRRFRAENMPGAHGAHSYTLEDWGLDADEIRERFGDYIERFGIIAE